MNKLFFLSLSALTLFTGCRSTTASQNYVDVINSGDVIDVGDLTQIATDFVVVPLKSNEPIDGIQGIKFFGDKAFGRNKDSKTIYCFDNYE